MTSQVKRLTLEEVEERIGNFLNKCPHCNHKQYSYTMQCEMCRFSWLRMYNQMKGIDLDTPYEKEKHLE